MDTTHLYAYKKEEFNQDKPKDMLSNLKSNYILKKIFNTLQNRVLTLRRKYDSI